MPRWVVVACKVVDVALVQALPTEDAWGPGTDYVSSKPALGAIRVWSFLIERIREVRADDPQAFKGFREAARALVAANTVRVFVQEREEDGHEFRLRVFGNLGLHGV